MKLWFASHASEQGGAERSLIELIKEAAARGHSIVVTTPRRGPFRDILLKETGIRAKLVPTHWWMSRRGRTLLGIVRTALCIPDAGIHLLYLGKGAPDLVVVNSAVTPGPLIAARILRIPSVAIVRELVVTGSTLRSWIPKKAIVWLLGKLATRMIVVSECAAREVGQGPESVIYSLGDPVEMAPALRRGSHGLLRCVYLGALTTDKCPEDAIWAVSLARAQGADVELDLYGAGPRPYMDRLRGLVAQLGLEGVVALRGPAPGPEVAFLRADVLLMTSKFEAFGRVTVEALTAGVPVIGYAAGATPEILSRGGGLLVAPDPESMSKAILRLSSDADEYEAARVSARSSGSYWRAYHSAGLTVDALEVVLDG